MPICRIENYSRLKSGVLKGVNIVIFDIRFVKNTYPEDIWCSFDTGFPCNEENNIEKIKQLAVAVEEFKEKLIAICHSSATA